MPQGHQKIQKYPQGVLFALGIIVVSRFESKAHSVPVDVRFGVSCGRIGRESAPTGYHVGNVEFFREIQIFPFREEKRFRRAGGRMEIEKVFGPVENRFQFEGATAFVRTVVR